MKKTVFCLAFALGFASLASAQTFNLPGRTIDVNQSGSGNSANIDYGAGAGVNASQNLNTGTSQVNTPGRSTTITPNSVQTTVGGTASVRVNAGPHEIQVSTEADLGGYRQAVVSECRGITSVSSSGSSVRINYRQPARLLGVLGTNLSGTIEVDSAKRVSVRLPWYSFLFSKDSNSVKTAVESTVLNIGSTTTLDVTTQATVISVVAGAISSETDGCETASVSVETNQSASSPSNSPTSTPTQTTTQTSSQQPINTGGSSAGVINFAGEWKGSWAPNAALPQECGPGGAVSMSVSQNGTFAGYAVVQGANWIGAGNVDASGNMTGHWSYEGHRLNLTGKMDFAANRASGSYNNNYGCFGTFSLSR